MCHRLPIQYIIQPTKAELFRLRLRSCSSRRLIQPRTANEGAIFDQALRLRASLSIIRTLGHH